MAKATTRPHWQISEACNRALYGWPYGVEPCPGYIESDHEPGSFYPCATCNPGWSRAAIAATPETR
jgi:hypothetical protein